MPKKIQTKDLILLLLFAKGYTGKRCEPISGRTRLVKMVFLFQKEILKSFSTSPEAVELPTFEPYDFGPFSSSVYSDLEFLVDNRFVQVQRLGDEPDEIESYEYTYWQMISGADEEESESREEQFALTDLGREFVEAGEAGDLTKNQWKLLDEFKARCTRASLRQLLRYVYKRYPEMTVKSTIANEILGQ